MKMKYFGILLPLFSFLLLSNSNCDKKMSTVYHGRLEVKGICMNYTICINGDKTDPALVEKSWTDPTTGTTYSNVFKLGSPCTFPPGIEQGDEFDFMIDSSPRQDCAVCMAYYPTPEKSLAIKIVNK